MKTLYEVNWHYDDNDTLTRISVTPIKVLREGILPGCSAVSITAVGSDGRQFQWCPQNYFETEDAAWAQAKKELQETLASEEQAVNEALRRIDGLHSVLNEVKKRAVMTDREMLEMAAKAAGLPEYFEGLISSTKDDPFHVWNPLKDDGDALRLAVRLGIDLEWRADGRVAAYRHANANGYCFTAFESSRENRAENTRRAIVHAAAEVGKRMIKETK